MDILRKIKLYPLVILVGLCLAVLYMGPLRPDNTLAVQWTGYIGFTLLVGVWCLGRILRRELIASTAIDAALLGLLAAFIIAALLSVDPRRSASLAVQVTLYLLAFLMVADLIAQGWERQAWIDALLWISGLVSLLSLLEVAFWYYSWYSLGGAAHPLPPFNYRLTSWLGHANMYAGMVIGLAPLAIAQWMQNRRIIARLGLAVWGLMAIIDLEFASSRGGWLVLGGTLALLALLLLYPRLKKVQWLKKIHLPRINWIIVCGVILSAMVLGGAGYVAVRLLNQPGHAPLLLSRSNYWPVAWNMFISSPLFGKGPETYYRFWLAARPFSVYGLANNPINIYLTLAAETGVVGLGAFLLAIGLGARKVIKVYQSSSANDRLWIAACASGLVGILVHGLSEITAVLYPAILFLLILAALLLSYGPAPARRTPAWLPLGLLLLAAGFLIYTGRGQAKFEQALQAGQAGNWQQAAQLSEQAAALDPEFAWYPLQAGYARGMAALSQSGQLDTTQLKLAIQDYQAGIALEPAYALNYANLASLYWQAGDHPSAIAEMNQAIVRDPSESVFLYNLGWMLEASGDQKGAADAYTRALQAAPLLGDAPIWNTPTRQTLHSGAPAAGLETEIKAMDASQLVRARQQFEKQHSANPFMPIPYRGLGLIAWQSGDLQLAEYNLNVSTRAYGDFTDHYTRQEAFLDLSDLAASQGQNAKAIAYGMQAFNAIDQYNLTGPGSLSNNSYANWVFHRASLPGDVLPTLLRPDMSTRLALRYITLGDRLEGNGQTVDACHVYRRVLQSVPDLAAGTQISFLCSTISANIPSDPFQGESVSSTLFQNP